MVDGTAAQSESKVDVVTCSVVDQEVIPLLEFVSGVREFSVEW